ncbi:hypothetical protein SAMN05519104_7448 [Rhizobiales bacterium GAS188]|nr:hypothetical protein SAMN05519104_7448 [Rhizobiales bacterium GAS188]
MGGGGRRSGRQEDSEGQGEDNAQDDRQRTGALAFALDDVAGEGTAMGQEIGAVTLLVREYDEAIRFYDLR